MLFLKNLLLRNFQGCCLLFNYQGSSLFFLRSSSDILSCCFFFVKNFFIFLFRCLFQKHSSPQVSLYRLSHPLSIVKNFFIPYSGLLSHPASVWPCGWFFSLVCLSDKWYLITEEVNCQCFFCFLFFSHNSDNLMFFSILKERRTSLLKATSFLC